MAEQALKKGVESSTENNAHSEKKSDKWGAVLLFLVALNVAGLAGLGYAVHKLWLGMQILKAPSKESVVTESDDVLPLGKELQPAKLGVLYGLEAFLVNIPTDQGTKFLQLQMEFELSDPSLEDELNRKKAAVRDSIIIQLSSKSFQELRGARAMKDLQQELLKSVNQLLVSGKVKDIYFTQFHFN